MPSCENCLKETELCVCDTLQPLKTKLHVLFLQHPQEPDKDLGTARIAHLRLPHSTLKIGLSWPNLKAALGREAVPARWAVLYLGSGVKTDSRPKSPLVFVDKKGVPLSEPPRPQDLDGIIVLDGTWSQAKAIWWRNAWLLKLRRVILQPARPSLYRELRREPRRECLSTLETTAAALTALGEPPEVETGLRASFQALLDRRRAQLKSRRARPGPGEA